MNARRSDLAEGAVPGGAGIVEGPGDGLAADGVGQRLGHERLGVGSVLVEEFSGAVAEQLVDADLHAPNRPQPHHSARV